MAPKGGKNGKGGSFWDDIFLKPFGGFADFNGDGKEDLGEQWIAHQIFEDMTKEEPRASRGRHFRPQISDWRRHCEDGSAYGIDPRNYSTQEAYMAALKEAKYGWRRTAEDDSDVDVHPEDYETEEEYEDALDEARYGWRMMAVDDGDVNPDDYETEEEYEEALEEAKHGWRKTAEDGSDVYVYPEEYETEEEYKAVLEAVRAGSGAAQRPDSGSFDAADSETEQTIREEDYPNRRRYLAAAALADMDQKGRRQEDEASEIERCHFILEQGDTVVAADYLTPDGDFLFAQAIKDHFDLPVTLPDEDETSEFSFIKILLKIEKKDVSLALRVWDWCVAQFLPYADYAPSARAAMTNDLLEGLYSFSDRFRKALLPFLNEHADFQAKIVRQAEEVPDSLPELIIDMVRNGFPDAAEAMFRDGLFRADGHWKQINALMNDLIAYAEDDEEELETMEFVETHFLPVVQGYPDGMIRDEIEGWEKEIAEYKLQVERSSEKYAYSRGNAWRKHVPDGSEYGLNPCDFDTEQEYLDALQKEKYAWREEYAGKDNLGLDPAQFETEDAFTAAWQTRWDEEQQKEQARQLQRLQAEQAKALARQRTQRKRREAELLADKTVYTYCGVRLPFSDRPYFFRTEDDNLAIGDAVIVPIGEEEKETEGIIVSVGRYARIGVPFPVEKTKFILRKAAAE